MSETMNERRHWVIHFSTRMTAIHAALAPTDQRKQPTKSSRSHPRCLTSGLAYKAADRADRSGHSPEQSFDASGSIP
jgi:hypothetical protein